MGQANTVPYEVIAAPYTLWLAAVGTTFPLIDAAPAVDWSKIGTSGNLNYMTEGVTIEHPQTVEGWRSLGDTAPRKYFRTEESLIVRVTIADLTLEQYKHALNDNTITTVAAAMGTAGYKKLGLSRGASIAQKALLVRGPSPYGDLMFSQYEVPIVFAGGSPSVVFANSGEPAGLELEFLAVVDPNASTEQERFGRLVAQTDDALT